MKRSNPDPCTTPTKKSRVRLTILYYSTEAGNPHQTKEWYCCIRSRCSVRSWTANSSRYKEEGSRNIPLRDNILLSLIIFSQIPPSSTRSNGWWGNLHLVSIPASCWERCLLIDVNVWGQAVEKQKYLKNNKKITIFWGKQKSPVLREPLYLYLTVLREFTVIHYYLKHKV